MTGRSAYAAATRLGSRKSGRPGVAEPGGDPLEVLVEEDAPAEVELTWSHRHGLPVENGDRPEVPEQHVGESGVAPATTADFVCRPVLLEPPEGGVDDGKEVPPRWRSSRSTSAGWPRGGAAACRPSIPAPKSQLVSARVDAVDPGEHVDHAGLDTLLLLGRRLGEPTAEHVRRRVGKRFAVHPLHHEEGRAERRRIGFEPPDTRHRDTDRAATSRMAVACRARS